MLDVVGGWLHPRTHAIHDYTSYDCYVTHLVSPTSLTLLRHRGANFTGNPTTRTILTSLTISSLRLVEIRIRPRGRWNLNLNSPGRVSGMVTGGWWNTVKRLKVGTLGMVIECYCEYHYYSKDYQYCRCTTTNVIATTMSVSMMLPVTALLRQR